MENVNMDQLKKEMENAPSMDEAINAIFGSDDDDSIKQEMVTLSKQISLMQSGMTTPKRIASEYVYSYATLSIELSNTMDSWMQDLAQSITQRNPEADYEKFVGIVDEGVKDLAEVLGDFLTRYHELGTEIPHVATRLRNTPPELKKVTDAYTKLYKDLTDAKELAHQMVEILGTDSDAFDHMVMKRVLDNESAGENNAQSAE